MATIVAQKESENSPSPLIVQKSTVAVSRPLVVTKGTQSQHPLVVKKSAIAQQGALVVRKVGNVYGKNFDPRKLRIQNISGPILHARNFRKIAENRYLGEINGVPIEVELTPGFPASPPKLFLPKTPRGFHHHIRDRETGRRIVCMTKLIDPVVWTPSTTLDNLFDTLEDEPNFSM